MSGDFVDIESAAEKDQPRLQNMVNKTGCRLGAQDSLAVIEE